MSGVNTNNQPDIEAPAPTIIFVTMQQRSQPPDGPSRYSYQRVTEEIERYLARSPRGTRKRLALAAGLEPDGFSHRMSGRYRFSYEEIGAIADEARGPTGWPWVPWETGEAFDAFRKLVNAAKDPTAA